VSIAKDKKYNVHPRKYNFPSWLRNMSKSKERRNIRNSVSAKVGCIYHTSPGKAREDILPHFSVIYDLNSELRALYTYILHLDRQEISFLTNKNPDAILKYAEKVKQKIEKG